MLCDLWKCLFQQHSVHKSYCCCWRFACLKTHRYMQIMFMSFLLHVLDFLPALCCRKRLHPHHHHHHHRHYHHPIPPPSCGPWGFKHPNQLKERGVHCGPPPTSVREGKQEGPHSWAVQGNNITPSVTNRFISDGMKYSSQIRLLLYHLCALAYSCPSLYQFPEAYTEAFCLRLPSSHQPAFSNHLANDAFKSSSV